MKVSTCMKRDVVSIHASDTIGQAALLFVDRHVGTLPVVDDQNKLVGILLLRNLLALVMPDFIRLVEDFDFVHDFGAVETREPTQEMLDRPVSDVMREPVSVEESSGLLRAAALLRHHDLLDLPIVTDGTGRLVGIASRVDVGVALLSSWHPSAGAGGAAP